MKEKTSQKLIIMTLYAYDPSIILWKRVYAHTHTHTQKSALISLKRNIFAMKIFYHFFMRIEMQLLMKPTENSFMRDILESSQIIPNEIKDTKKSSRP